MSKSQSHKQTTQFAQHRLWDISGWIIMGIYLLVGILIYTDFGYSWDEILQRNHGIGAWQIVDDLLGTQVVEAGVREFGSPVGYGMVYSMSCFAVERMLGLSDFSSVFRLRHLMIFLLSALAALCMWRLLRRRFGSGLAIAGLLLYILHPRIFGHSFYNPKDLVLLSFISIALYTLMRSLQKPTWGNIILHAVTCSLAINARIPGLTVMLMTLAAYATILLKGHGEWKHLKARLTQILAYLVINGVLFIALSPQRLERLLQDELAVAAGARLSSQWDSQLVYFGQVYNASDMPWHYIPAWIGITTPILFILLLIVGMVVTSSHGILQIWKTRSFKKLVKGPKQLMDLVCLAMLAAVLFAIFIKDPNLYNGWRHMYFLYAPMVVLMSTGLHWICTQTTMRLKAKWASQHLILATACVLLSIGPIYKILALHPIQAVYFNSLVAADSFNRFDQDYWGVSYFPVIQKLLEQDPNSDIKIYSSFPIGKYNMQMLDAKDLARISAVSDINEADYFITIYLWDDHSKYVKNQYPLIRQNEIIRIDARDTPIAGVYKLR